MNKSSDPAIAKKRKIAGEKPTYDKSTSPVWEVFSERLIEVLQGLEQGQWLILQKVGSSSDWVQFFSEGEGRFRVEAKSNFFRELADELSLEQEECLSRIGWRQPTGSGSESTPERDPRGSPNYFRDITLPRHSNKLVNVTVATFTDVLCVVAPEGLEYQAFYASGDSLSIPRLGLKPVVTSIDTDQNPLLPRLVLEAVKELTDIQDWSFDGEGDLGPIFFCSICCYVRLVEDRPHVRIYAPLLHDMVPTQTLLSRLNEMNCLNGFLHLCLMPNGCVMAVSDVLASPFDTSNFANAFGNFLQVADDFNTELQADFGDDDSTDLQPLKH